MAFAVQNDLSLTLSSDEGKLNTPPPKKKIDACIYKLFLKAWWMNLKLQMK